MPKKYLVTTALLLTLLLTPSLSQAFSLEQTARTVYCTVNDWLGIESACTEAVPTQEDKLKALIGKPLYKQVAAAEIAVDTGATTTEATSSAERVSGTVVYQQPIITNPVVERTIETRTIVQEPSFTLTQVTDALNALRTELNNRISQQSLPASYGAPVAPQYPNTWGLTQKIDRLFGVVFTGGSISDTTITDTPISGSAGSFTALSSSGPSTFTSLSASGDATISGTTTTGNLVVTGSLTTPFTQGSVPFANASGVLAQDNANFFWDETNHRLGVGTTTPSVALDVNGIAQFVSGLITPKVTPLTDSATAVQITKADGTTSIVSVDTANGRVGIGTTSPEAKLDVVGGNIRVDSGRGLVGSNAAVGHFVSGNQASITSYDDLLINGWNGSTYSPFVTVKYNTGNVGIGTTGPSNKLTILSSTEDKGITVRESDDGNDAVNILASNSQGYLELLSGGTKNVRLLAGGVSYINGGNVGIGTTAPGAKLDVRGTQHASLAQTSGAGYWGGVFKNTAGSNTEVDLAGSTYAALFNNGNVGIGTTAPGIGSTNKALTISDTATGHSTALELAGTNSGGLTSELAFYGGGLLYKQSKIANINGGGDSGSGNLAFYTVANSASDFSERMRITNQGNVGIGTTSPSGKLHVYTSSGDVSAILDSPTNSYLYFEDAGTAEWHLGRVDSNNRFAVVESGAGERLSILSGGNVGIGTTGPSSKLQIDGGGFALKGGVSNDVARPAIGAGFAGLIDGEIWAYSAGAPTHQSGLLRLSAGGGTTAGYKSWIDVAGYSSVPDVNGSIVFGTSGSEKVRINSQGNVGIGTTAPASILDITAAGTSGIINLRGAAGEPGLVVRKNDTGGYFGIRTQNTGTGLESYLGGNNLFISNTGNVGIGTTNPTEKLTIQSGNIKINSGDLNLNGSNVIRQSGAFPLYLQADTANPIVFRTSISSEKMRITDTGNVGIGTTAPATKLHIEGSSQSSFTGTTQGNLAIGVSDDTSGNYRSLTFNNNTGVPIAKIGAQRGSGGSVLTFGTSNLYSSGITNTAMAIDNQGNVGIGTTGPAAKLDVNGTVNIADHITLSRGGGQFITKGSDTANYLLISGGSSSGGANAILYGSTHATEPDVLALRNSGGERMRITSNGNVGIGTTSPSAKLDVYSTTGTNVNLESQSAGIAGIVFNTPISSTAYTGSITSSAFGNGMTFTVPRDLATKGFFFNSNSGATRMYIDSTTGNVGIGTTSPAYKLHVAGTSHTYGEISASATDTTVGLFLQNDANRWLLKINGTTNSDAFEIKSDNNSNPSLVIDTSGNVGIGTTNPSLFKLQIAGNVGPNASNTYNLGAAGSNWGCLYYDGGTLGTCASDEKLKENIQPLSFGDNVIEKLMSLGGRVYTYKADDTHSEYHGLVAQEVQQEVPELVATSSDGYLTVKYGDLQWLLLEAVQKMWRTTTKKFGEIFAQLATHESRIDSMEARIQSLEAQLAATGAATSPIEASGEPFELVITLYGNNPAEIAVGATYSDMGAIALNPDGNELTIRTYVDDTPNDSVHLDTSEDRTYTISYEATWDNQTVTAERTVIVGTGTPEVSAEAESTDIAADTPAEDASPATVPTMPSTATSSGTVQ